MTFKPLISLISLLPFGLAIATTAPQQPLPPKLPKQATLHQTVATKPQPTPTKLASQSTATPVNRIIAIVNNDIVTQDQLNRAVNQAKMQAEQSGISLPSNNQLQRHVLKRLIIQKIAVQLAKTNHITVESAQVDQAIQGILANNHTSMAQLHTALEQSNITYAQYKKSIHDQLLISKIEQQAVASSIMITPTEIDHFLAARAKLPHKNSEYQVSHILIALPNNPTAQTIAKTQQKALNVLNKIHHGLSFTKAAMQYSDAPDGSKGGQLSFETLDQLPTLIATHVPGMTTGQVSQPIQDANGFHILKLDGIKTPKTQTHFVQQANIRQILIKTSPIMSSAKAKTILTHLYNEAINGHSFAALAKANSQASTSRHGGKTGWVSLESLDPATQTAIATLKPKGISKPFKVAKGWQIIQLIGQRKQENTKAYERQQATETLFRQKAANALKTWQDKIVGESYIKILDPALTKLF